MNTSSAKAVSTDFQFNYEGRADLYPGRGKHRGKGLGYRRFDRAASAIQYAVEEMPPSQAIGTVLEVDERRFTMNEIAALYQRSAYPLRRAPKSPVPDDLDAA
jgi:hypothetical protein